MKYFSKFLKSFFNICKIIREYHLSWGLDICACLNKWISVLSLDIWIWGFGLWLSSVFKSLICFHLFQILKNPAIDFFYRKGSFSIALNRRDIWFLSVFGSMICSSFSPNILKSRCIISSIRKGVFSLTINVWLWYMIFVRFHV